MGLLRACHRWTSYSNSNIRVFPVFSSHLATPLGAFPRVVGDQTCPPDSLDGLGPALYSVVTVLVRSEVLWSFQVNIDGERCALNLWEVIRIACRSASKGLYFGQVAE
jgi:hypothetical protein